MEVSKFSQYVDALSLCGVPSDVLDFIVTVYGHGTSRAVALLNDAAYSFVGYRDADSLLEAMSE